MEAIWKIEVEDFPAFILVDDKGNDFFQQIQLTQCTRCVEINRACPSGGFYMARKTKRLLSNGK